MATVALQDVCKTYPGNVKAVDGVSLSIQDREFVVLVGPSGCGKSTTLRMIAGLEAITAGQISIDGRVVNDVAPKDRDIAMVFQNYALYPHMTVFKNMAFSLKLRKRELGLKRADIERKVREAAKILGIEDLLDRRPKALSGGQRQRVAVGRAIVRNPKVFLFDEPLSNLDAKLRVEMRSEIKRLQRRLETTTIYVTHDQEEAMTLGDRVVVMKDGVIHQMASPLEVYQHPVNRFVASFVGTPPMNFVDGQLVADGDGATFVFGAQRMPVVVSNKEAAQRYHQQSMVLGIRPDIITTPEATTPRSEHLAALLVTVGIIEPLGDRKDVYLTTTDGQQLVARLPASVAITEGEQRKMYVDMARAHVFESGEAGANIAADTTVLQPGG